MSGRGAALAAAYDAAARQRQRQQFLGMNAYDRHRKMVHDLVAYYGAKVPDGSAQAGPQKTDFDILRENHRFIRSEGDDAADSWEVRLAKRYYSKLFKEYAIADLSRHQEGRVGLRWRTQKEVVAGKGQFACGATGCEERRGLASFEVAFAYEEAGERKQALVKVRLCPTHAYQLNYRKHQQAEAAQREKEERRQRRKEKEREREEGKGSKEKGKDKGRRKEKERGKERRRSGGSSSKERKRRRRSCSSSERDSSGGSSSEEEAADGQRGSGKRRRRSGEAEPAAADAPQAAGEPAAEEFEAFLAGLFE